MEIMTITPILSVIILFLLMLIMTLFYCKISNKEEFLIVLILFLFSLIIGIDSIKQGIIPFSPYFQFFFLLFQTIIFLFISIEVRKVYKKF